jgi:hypothetical protein
MEVTTSTQIRVQKDQDYWYIVEDTNIEISYYGCTISYWEKDSEGDDTRIQYITMEKEEALALASAIYKLFGDTK